VSSSASFAGATGARAPAAPAVAVIGAKPTGTLAWWLDPVRAVGFVVLPIFCFAAYFNRFNYWSFNASGDFITRQTFGLGLYSMAMLVLGMLVGKLALRRRDTVSVVDADRAARVLARIGWVTIIAYALLLGAVLTELDLVVALLRGDVSAGSELRTVIGRIPGVTSFIQFGVVYLALASALVTLSDFRLTSRMWVMTGVIFALAFLRSVLASERLALLEALAAVFLISGAYRWKPSVWRTLAPFLGIVFVFLAFAAGEYFRSWQYYRMFYGSYAEFITQRFAGYFSTSINNGAGAYLMFGQHNPHPEITVGWVTRFPGLGSLFRTDELSMMDRFLEFYATPEFNNPGGFYAAFLDYGFAVASLFMVILGTVIGVTYSAFRNKSLLGLILYPAVFLGTTDLIRIVYVTDTRALPIFLGCGIAVWALRPLRMPRETFLARVAG
jgi:hypothetical protein